MHTGSARIAYFCDMNMDMEMKTLVDRLHDGGHSCVIRNGKVTRTFDQRGVADLYDLYEREPSFLHGAEMADKVVGKGAAALMVLGGIRRLHADVISDAALELLRGACVDVTFGTRVPHIINRKGDGRCPLEQRTEGAATAEEAFPLIKSFVEALRGGKSTAVALLLALAASAGGGECFAQSDSTVTDRQHRIEGVVVTGTRNETDARLLPMTVSVVGRQRLEAAWQPSLLQTLTEEVPGLFVTGRGMMGYGVSTGAAGGLSMRGLAGNAQMLVLVDGHPQYMGLFGHPIADAYQTMMAERVEVVRGPASVLYGSNAMGGVVNIVTRSMPTDGSETEVTAGMGSYMTVQTEAVSRHRRGKLTSTAAVSYNRSDGHRENMGFEQYGGYVTLGYAVNERWDLHGDVNVTHFNASNPGPVTAPMIDNDQKVTRGMASLSLSNDYGRTSGRLGVYYNWGRHNINDGHTADEPAQTSLFNSKDMMMGVSWWQSAALGRGGRLTAGFDFQHFGGRTWNEDIATGTETPGVDEAENDFAGYLDYRQSIGTLLTLDAGIRVGHHTRTGTEVIPQGGVSLHLPRNVEMKAMVSKGYRNPTIRELYMFMPRNPELAPERLVNYELSLSQRLLGGALRYGVNVFYINGSNAIVLDQSIPRYMNTGKIRNAGVEATFNYNINACWNVNANYAYAHMDNPVIAAPTHKLDASARFVKGRWTATTGIQYVNGLYTAVGRNEQTEDFVLWNVRGSFRACRFATLFVKGENLLAQRYETMLGYPMPRATVMGGVKLNF